MSVISSMFNYASETADSFVKQAVSIKDKVSGGITAVGNHISENKRAYAVGVAVVGALVVVGTLHFLQSEVGPVRHRGQMFVEMDAVNKMPVISLGAARRLSAIVLKKPLNRVVDPSSLMV